MKTCEEISHMSLAQCNEELGAMCEYSMHTEVEEAREALYNATRTLQLSGLPTKFYDACVDGEYLAIAARDWLEAIEMLADMLPEDAIFSGSWGWVKDDAGHRHCINC